MMSNSLEGWMIVGISSQFEFPLEKDIQKNIQFLKKNILNFS